MNVAAGHRVASKELGDTSANRPWALHVQQMSYAFNPAVLDLWEPGVKQLVTIHEQLLRLHTKHREHWQRDGRCLIGTKLPRCEGRQIAREEIVDVLVREIRRAVLTSEAFCRSSGQPRSRSQSHRDCRPLRA